MHVGALSAEVGIRRRLRRGRVAARLATAICLLQRLRRMHWLRLMRLMRLGRASVPVAGGRLGGGAADEDEYRHGQTRDTAGSVQQTAILQDVTHNYSPMKGPA